MRHDHRADDLAAVVREIKPLAQPAIDAVRSGAIQIVPQSWEATYFNWMENIYDWTISRQLWWGHRIPAYYCGNGHTIVSEEDRRRVPSAAPRRSRRRPTFSTPGSSRPAVAHDGLA
jgi:valyl-tRNA synthetase